MLESIWTSIHTHVYYYETSSDIYSVVNMWLTAWQSRSPQLKLRSTRR